MASEKQLENKIKKYLKSRNIYYIKYWGGGIYTKNGVPDILACVNGHFVGIEVKAEKGIISELQKYNIEQINASGGMGYVVYPKDYEKLIKELERMMKG